MSVISVYHATELSQIKLKGVLVVVKAHFSDILLHWEFTPSLKCHSVFSVEISLSWTMCLISVNILCAKTHWYGGPITPANRQQNTCHMSVCKLKSAQEKTEAILFISLCQKSRNI